MDLYGYGKILDIDLSTRKIIKRDIDPKFAQKFIGGMGFSCKILYDEVGADVDPLSPENIVIFANGLLTGTSAPCSGRTEISTKSPLTGTIGTGNTGGIWGAALKHAGFDLIILRNRAEKPVYLWIDDDVIEIIEANHLWGEDTSVTSDVIRRELGTTMTSNISVLSIGPAGENLIRYACPLNDYHHVAGRAGVGAVMGAKRLKAIAVRGTGTVKMARPDEFEKAVKEAREILREAMKASSERESVSLKVSGSKGPREVWAERGALATKNFQGGTFPPWTQSLSHEEALKYITKKESTCYRCPIACFDLAEVNDGKYKGVKVNRGLHAGVVNDFGPKCGFDSLPAIWKCKELCQQLGMDYASLAGTISFAMELFQRGIITKKDTDGLELSWGNDDATAHMIRKIALRDGFGDILAEGSVRAAKKIGKEAEKYAMAIKGMEMMGFDPRTSFRGMSFEEITDPRGGDNLKGGHHFADIVPQNWGVEKYDMFEDVKKNSIRHAPPGSS